MRALRKRGVRRKLLRRPGLASLDYVLILGVILPLVAFIMWIGPRMMQLVYEMYCVLVSSPFI